MRKAVRRSFCKTHHFLFVDIQDVDLGTVYTYVDYQTLTSTVPHVILVLILISRVCLGLWLQIEKMMLSWTNSGTFSKTYINLYLFMGLLCNAYTTYIHLMFMLSLLRLSRF